MRKRIWTCLLLVAVISTATLCIAGGKKDRTTQELMNIAAAGGGLVLDANGREPKDLMNIAAACGGGGGTLYLKNCGEFETTDLMRIAAAGSKHVVLEF